MLGSIMVPAEEVGIRRNNEETPPAPIVASAATMAASSAADVLGDDSGAPCDVEIVDGDFARLIFRPVPGHRHDEPWQHRHVRKPPAVPCGRLAYYNSSKTVSNSNVLQVILRDHGYERAEGIEEDWSIFWCAGQVEPSVLRRFLPHQKVNKFPKATALTLKQNLWQCVKSMITKHGEEHFGFMPPTFVLPRELKAFEARLRARLLEAGGEHDVWIFKPAAAYCGRGIFLHRTDPLLRAAAASTGSATAEVLTDEMHEHKGVVSSYIDPPFLLDGLKSDVRLYVLVTSWHPLTCYLYEDGLARFATETYDTAGLDERCGHLTNYSLNKHSDKFVRNTNEAEDGSGSKWSLAAFKRRLTHELGEERASKVWRDVDDLVVKTCIAAEPSITDALQDNVPAAARGEPVRQCFQLFGFDVMLDAAVKPYLLEVNLDPALRTESPLDLKIKSTMLVDLLNVVGMPLPPLSSPTPDRNKENKDATAGGSLVDPVDISDGPADSAPAQRDKHQGDGTLQNWVQSAASAASASSALTDAERWAIHLVNDEYKRSKSGKWRRLFPSARSEDYYQFLDPSHTMHRLKFDV